MIAIVKNEKPIDRPAPSADQAIARIERSSIFSPSSRTSSWMTRASGGVGPVPEWCRS